MFIKSLIVRLLVGALLTIGILLLGPVLSTPTSEGLSSFAEPVGASTEAETGSDPARPAPVSAPARAPSGRLIVSAESNGTWDLFAADPESGSWQSMAVNVTPARDPAISPDGRTLAFRSHRDGFWEIYSMPANGITATRLTRGMTFSGAPVWSPDGKKIAFESYARGDLDVWTMNADGSQISDMTDDSRFQDYGPAWSPDGKWIAFTSWRTGLQQIFVVPSDCNKCLAANISQTKFNDQQPAWSPDGKRMAFVSDRDGQRAIYTAEIAGAGMKEAKRITFSGWDERPTWSPDGQWIAFVSARPTRQPVYIVPSEGGLPRLLEDGPSVATSVAWAPDSIVAALGPNAIPVDATTSLYPARPDLSAAGSGHPYEMRRITSTRLDPGINKLNGRVADAFGALQTRVKQDVGYDFLGVLAEMARVIDYRCDITCDTLSWHKAGRAFDTRLDYNDGRGGALEIVREDQQGETFWRILLRASAQDGSMGEPMKEPPWDLGYRARWIAGRGEGGMKKPIPSGFFVDFTELAREYGWERISSHANEDFDWRTNTIATEYWHYQRMQGLNWYQAMREVFSEPDLNSLTDWNALVSRYEYDPYLLYLKGIPAPSKSWRWNALGP